MNWNQPICRRCWDLENPGRNPVVIIEPVWENCSTCGDTNADGIYVRKDPRHLNYPKGSE